MLIWTLLIMRVSMSIGTPLLNPSPPKNKNSSAFLAMPASELKVSQPYTSVTTGKKAKLPVLKAVTFVLDHANLWYRVKKQKSKHGK